jgi:hypothetical protein
MRVADCDHELPDAETLCIAELCRDEVACIDPQDG